LRREPVERHAPPPVPSALDRPHGGIESTQQGFGRFFMDLAHGAPDVAARVVSLSPDVASSTNLGGWINRAGVWSIGERIDWFADDSDTLVRWRATEHGQHIELGIAEGNLVGLLGELGATFSRDGEALLPIGTLYDPFVNRALEPWSFGIYAGGQSILVGTPSGVTLAPEGGAHQSIITPSVGIEQPRCIASEPAFGQDLEWLLLRALSLLGHDRGSSSYLRLSTRPIDQSLARVPDEPVAREARRRQVLAGGYRLREAPGAGPPAVTLAGMGAIMPELLAAAEELSSAGVAVDVLCVTSADLLFRALQAQRGLGGDRDEGTSAGDRDSLGNARFDGDTGTDASILDELFPPSRRAPLVTVLDGHPHALSVLGALSSGQISCLGVRDFGQSGDVQDLYRHFGIDAEEIAGAALDLIA
jgi:pyruvate dehydrogenase E1 component